MEFHRVTRGFVYDSALGRSPITFAEMAFANADDLNKDACSRDASRMLREGKEASMTKDFDPAHAAANGYTREDWNAVDSPELTDDELAQAKPMREAMPELHAAITDAMRKRGPARTKTPVSIRLDDDVLAKLRATGSGWQSRANDVLRRYVEEEAGA